MTTISRLTTVVTILLFWQLSFGQTVPSDMKNDNEHFSELPDSIMKNEVALFNVKGASIKKIGSNNQLVEIPIDNCTDTAIHLNKGSTYIGVFFKDRSLDSIFLVTHSHYWIRFPKHAFKGIYTTHLCNFNGGRKQDKFFFPYFKAFYTKDNRRLYIYMQGGTDTNKYEVTWVIVNGRYYTRIIDNIL
jgi:hypothetical protein